jgi:DUF4097 and DUF4098 domain-containing protein YvlB
MGDEKIMILKMLKDEKISVEEAEALLDALQESEKTNQESKSAIIERVKHREGGKKSRGFKLDIDFEDLEGIGEKIKETFGEVGKTLKEAFKDFDGDFFAHFGSERASKTWNGDFSLEGVEKLLVENKWGDVTITGESRDSLGVEAKISAWADSDERAEEILEGIEIVLEDSKLHARGIAKSRIRIDYEILLPEDLFCEVHNNSGDVEIEHLSNGARVHTLSGDIQLEDLGTDLEIHSASGDISLDECRGKVQVRTASGDISVNLTEVEGIQIESASGDISLELPSHIEATISAKTASGEISCELDGQEYSDSEHSLETQVNGGGVEIRLRTASGDISLES